MESRQCGYDAGGDVMQLEEEGGGLAAPQRSNGNMASRGTLASLWQQNLVLHFWMEVSAICSRATQPTDAANREARQQTTSPRMGCL